MFSISKPLGYINEFMAQATDNAMLTKAFESLLPELYKYIQIVLAFVTKPIGYAVLALFMLIEIQRIANRAEGSGSNMVGVEGVFKALARTVIFKAVIDNVENIMVFFYKFSTSIISDLGKYMNTSLPGIGPAMRPMDLQTALQDVNGIDADSNDMILWALLMFICIIAFLVLVYVDVVIAFRVIELYVFLAFAPIPLATLPNEEFSQIGKSFLKNYAATCLHGTFLFFTCYIMPLTTGLFPKKTGSWSTAASLALYLGLYCYIVMASSKWAKALTGAAG